MLSKRSLRLYLLICDSLFKTPLKLQHLLPDSHSLQFLFNEALGLSPLTFTLPHFFIVFFLFFCLWLFEPPSSLRSISKQSPPIQAFILTFHCVLFPTSLKPSLCSLCPTSTSFTSLSSLSAITSDHKDSRCPENDEDEGYIWLPARDRLLKGLRCQSVGHISRQLQSQRSVQMFLKVRRCRLSADTQAMLLCL